LEKKKYCGIAHAGTGTIVARKQEGKKTSGMTLESPYNEII